MSLDRVMPYSLRLARSLAYRLVMKIDNIFYGLLDPYMPVELSVKESFQKESEDGETAETTYTFRFESGYVVRLHLNGWNTEEFGFQWKVESALLRFFTEASWIKTPHGKEKEVVWLPDWQSITGFLEIGRVGLQKTLDKELAYGLWHQPREQLLNEPVVRKTRYDITDDLNREGHVDIENLVFNKNGEPKVDIRVSLWQHTLHSLIKEAIDNNDFSFLEKEVEPLILIDDGAETEPYASWEEEQKVFVVNWPGSSLT